MSQFNHVSQFLQTTLGLSFALVITGHIIIIYRQLPYQLKEIRQAQLKKQQLEQQSAQVVQAPPADSPQEPGSQIPQSLPKPIPQNKTSNPEQDLSEEQRRSYRLFKQINIIFDEYIPVLMCCMIVGILVAGTYVLSAICFFCSLFFNLVFNYGKLYDKIEKKSDNKGVKVLLEIMANIFIVIYFIGLLIRVYFEHNVILSV